MKKVVISIFLSLLVLMLISGVMAYTEPQVIVKEEPVPSWFEQLFKEPFDVTGGRFVDNFVNKGEYVNAKINVKFYHDCEKYKLDFWFMSPGQIGGIVKTAILNYPHKTGDTVVANMQNLPTSQIPDSYCGKEIKGYARHYSYYGGYDYGDGLCHLSEPVMSSDCTGYNRLTYNKPAEWHQESGAYLDSPFVLICQGPVCEKKPIGNLFCDSDGDVAQKWQFENCIITDMTIEFCNNGQCSNGKCSIPCETGLIGSKFCKGNSVYQRYGLGLGDMECKFEDKLIQTCLSTQSCDKGQCINTQSCGDGICNNGETFNTCPSDCEKPWICGDGACNSDETQLNCCKDCGCAEGYTCISQIGANGVDVSYCASSRCSAGETKTGVCEDGSTIITHTCQNYNWVETGNECPSGGNWWIWVLVILIIGGAGTGIYFIIKRGK